ncbi:MAG TPA: LysM peptidoglycan-binding domain-containing protein [Candidatus Eisenbacteria bacterium]|nr:LysM peptidoglycan-binding domain-containing protein [Candidatus Eisenbacteria bacterium]
MPRQKKKKVVRSKIAPKTQRKSFRFGWMENWMQSYSSFLLGIVVVIIGVFFVVSIIRQQNHVQQTSSLSTGPTPTPSASSGQANSTPGTTLTEGDKTYYVVKPNDSLWSIAETVYNDSYRWTEIAEMNNIQNPSTIFSGDKLLLPNASQPSELGHMMQSTPPVENAITGNSYTVKEGDTLWDIAVRAYADGYSWTKIANANNLSNPNLIFSGNVLTLPR